MSEAQSFSDPRDLPGDSLEQNDVLLIILPDLLVDPVVHGLQVPPVRHPREEQSGVLEYVPAPRNDHQYFPLVTLTNITRAHS